MRTADLDDAAAGWRVRDLPLDGAVTELAMAARPTTHETAAAVISNNGSAVTLALRNNAGQWTTQQIAATADFATAVESLTSVAIAADDHNRLWVAAASGPDVWVLTEQQPNQWSTTRVRSNGDPVMEMAAAAEGHRRVHLVLRTANGIRGHLSLLTMEDAPDNHVERLLDVAVAAPAQMHLVAAGVDDAGRLRVLHARSASELVYTAALETRWQRDVVELPDGHVITAVKGAFGRRMNLVETHSTRGEADQLLTHRCD